MTDRLRETATAALQYMESVGKMDMWPEEWAIVESLRAALAEPVPEPGIIPEWMPCVKLPITVHVRKQRPGEMHISTREGITPVKSDDLIMRGVEGEEYPIGRELFNRTYRLGETESPDDELTRLRAEVDQHKATIKAMTLWLEVNQRDVWKRGIWESIDAARAALKEEK